MMFRVTGKVDYSQPHSLSVFLSQITYLPAIKTPTLPENIYSAVIDMRRKTRFLNYSFILYSKIHADHNFHVMF